jgi:hypothetical protein
VKKLAKGDYTSYNSCERHKKEGYKPSHNYEVKCLNLYLTSSDGRGAKNTKVVDNSNAHLKAKNAPKNNYKNKETLRTTIHKELVRTRDQQRGRQLLEKHKHPNERFSRKFFSEEKYHYSQNLRIEEELREFKKVP